MVIQSHKHNNQHPAHATGRPGPAGVCLWTYGLLKLTPPPATEGANAPASAAKPAAGWWRWANLLKTAVSVLASTVRLTVSFMEPLVTVSVMLRCSQQAAAAAAAAASSSALDAAESS